MSSSRPSRMFTALAAVAAAGLMAAGCSSQPDTAASPSSAAPAQGSTTSYPAFRPLNDDSEIPVPSEEEPAAPQPTMPGAAGGANPDTKPHQALQAQQGQQPQAATQHQTNESAREATMDHIYGQHPKNGATVNVYGTQAQVCLMGDGYHIGITMAAPNTSCDFAETATRTLLNFAPGSRVDLRHYVPANITVNSPITQKDYDLSCRVDEHEIIRCTGGDNAEVLIV